ncbi:hypothetical protein ACFWNN_09775 [Lentzea sp. NPDC058450]|uniref:hypothetical protein n=1 Tax=Lentzea sp. NPDC058450 TaxID=3346505 RepID=UPI00365547CA
MSPDGEILGRIHDLWEQVDPAPGELAAHTAFACAFATPDDEIARAVRHPRTAGARGDEEARLITFEARSLTLTLSITAESGDTVRLDGWITSARGCPVELRTAAGVRTTEADGNGRFSFAGVTRTLTQFAVRANGTVTTPAIAL